MPAPQPRTQSPHQSSSQSGDTGLWRERKIFHSLVPARSGYDFRSTIFNLVVLIGIFRSYDNTLRWMSWDFTDGKSTLVQITTWCHQPTSHYLIQCWPRRMSPYGVTGPQWVNPFFWGNINTYLHFLSLLNTQTVQVVEILPHGRQGPVYPT